MGNFFIGLWNTVINIAPTVFRAACEVVETLTNQVKVGS